MKDKIITFMFVSFILTFSILHLVIKDEEANKKVNTLIKQFAEQEIVNEELKANNQLEWVQRMNNIKNRA